jgi:pimeloyl-ACP methyl ester carboxylesterase
MKGTFFSFAGLASIAMLALTLNFPTQAHAETTAIASKTATVDGVKLHYLSAGHGTPLILLHGYTQTSRMWTPIIPVLAKKFMVIAPDLPGIGDSAIPSKGPDFKTAAVQIHGLAKSLGVQNAEVVGHDIGLMVAYAYATQFPSEVTKLVLMDAFIPGVGDWGQIYNNPGSWHFRFLGPTPLKLVTGRERTYFEHYWNDFAADKTKSLPEADRRAYTAAYSRAGRMTASWAYFKDFPSSAKDFAQSAQTKLTIPVLTIGGDQSLGDFLAKQVPLAATNVKSVIIKDAGHWVMEEKPKETLQALQNFL